MYAEKDIKEIFSENPVPKPIARKIRWIVFIVIITLTVFMSIDQGILSSTTSEIKEDLKMDDVALGSFGGMIFLGTAIGCIFSFTLINKYNRKYLLIITISLDAIGIFFITQTTNKILLYICRVVSGFSTSFLSIYSPVWSDQFGIHSKKSLMMSFIHIFSSLGYILGYGFGSWFGLEISLYIQVIVLIILNIIIIFLLPLELFSSTLIPLKGKINNKNNNENKNDNIINDDININNDNNNINDDISLFEDIGINNNNSNSSIILHTKILIKSPIFLLVNLCLASIFIIVSGIQFWTNDYFEKVLNVDNQNLIFLSFTIVVTTSPILGMLIGGILSQKLGGYDTEKAIYIPLYSSLCVCIFANIIILTKNYIIFTILFWFYLFFGSIILPVSNGIVLCSVDKQYSGSASSITTLIYNILGKFIGPIYYALFKELINDEKSRIPMWLLLNVAIIGFIANLFCVKYQKKKYNLLEKNNEREMDLANKL